MNKNLDYIKNTIKSALESFKLGTETMFKEFFNKETNKKQRANMWSFTRIIIPLITIITSAIAIITSSYPLFVVTGVVAGLGAVTDALDGASARKHKSNSEYGKVLDQVTDKFFAGVIGINLLFINPVYIYTLIGEVLIAAINTGFKLKYHDLDIKSTMVGKFKTWPLYITLALGFLSPINSTLLTISNISIAITLMAQLATCASYLDNNSKEAKKLIRKQKLEEANTQIEEENEKENEKELALTKEKEKTLLEKYKELSNLLKQLIETKEKDVIEDISNDTKTKKL